MNGENLHIDEAKTIHLPAYAIADEVNRKLQEHNRLIITAEPGAGKSTLLPLTILKGFPNEGKIILLEPRRIAAKQIAERMADLLHEKVGETVGYQVRFENCTSAQTRIVVMTEGILPRMLVGDPFLEGISAILFDEFHRRGLGPCEGDSRDGPSRPADGHHVSHHRHEQHQQCPRRPRRREQRTDVSCQNQL